MYEYAGSLFINFPVYITTMLNVELYTKELLLNKIESKSCFLIEDLKEGNYDIYCGWDDRKNVGCVSICNHEYLTSEVCIARHKLIHKPQEIIVTNAISDEKYRDYKELYKKMGDDTIRSILDTFLAYNKNNIIIKNELRDNVYIDVCYSMDYQEAIGFIIQLAVDDIISRKKRNIFDYDGKNLKELTDFCKSINTNGSIPCPYIETGNGNFLLRPGDLIVETDDDFISIPRR